MIFCGDDAYFPWEKGGPEKNYGRKGGALKFFCADFFLHQAPLTSVCERSLIVLKHNLLITFRITRGSVITSLLNLKRKIQLMSCSFNYGNLKSDWGKYRRMGHCSQGYCSLKNETNRMATIFGYLEIQRVLDLSPSHF